jgi:hypothetical protein
MFTEGAQVNQETSRDAFFREARTQGLSQRRQMVLDYVASHPHCTQNECERDLASGGAQRSFGGRFSELVEMGMIRVSGNRPDPVTGKKNITYLRTRRRIPLPLDKLAQSRDNRSLLERFEEVCQLEEKFRIQELQHPGEQQASTIQRKKQLREMILRRMNRYHTPASGTVATAEVLTQDQLDDLLRNL